MDKNNTQDAIEKLISQWCNDGKLDKESNDLDKSFKKINSLIISVSKLSGGKIKNSIVADAIYKRNDNEIKNLEKVVHELEALLDQEESDSTNDFGDNQDNNSQEDVFFITDARDVEKREDNKKIYKFVDAIELSISQRDYIKSITKDAEKKLDKIEKDSEKIAKMKDNIYSDLISVLGVFTAISFAAFGGITAVSNMFSGLNDKKPHIGYLLICAGIAFLLIYGVSMTLFIGINKLIKVKNGYKFSVCFTSVALILPACLIILGIVLISIFKI